MKSFIESFFVYSMYAISLATIVLGIATILIPINDGTYNSTIMGSVLILLGGKTFLVTRKLLDA